MTKAIILAAGEGRRLRPYTNECPKCLVEVNGKSLLDYQLMVLNALHIRDISIVAGYLEYKIEREGVTKYLNMRYAETNMLWSLFCAEDEMSDELILSYGDIVYSHNVLNKLLQSSHDISVVIDLIWESYWRKRFIDPLDDAETLKLDGEGRIIEIGKSPFTLKDIEGQYVGLMKLSKKGLSIVKDIFISAKECGYLDNKQVEKAYMTDLLQVIINKGNIVMPVFISGEWVEIDTVSDLNLEITRQRLDIINDTINWPI